MYEAQNAFSPPVQFLQKAGGGAGLLVKQHIQLLQYFLLVLTLHPWLTSLRGQTQLGFESGHNRIAISLILGFERTHAVASL